jgi:hypothetical protein
VRVEEAAGDREELAVALQVLDTVKRYGAFMGLPKQMRKALPPIIERTKRLIAAPSYSVEDRYDFWMEVARSLPPGLIQPPWLTTSALLDAALDGMRDLERHKEEGTTRESTYVAVRYAIRDILIRLKPTGPDRFELTAYYTGGFVQIRYHEKRQDIGAGFEPYGFRATGTRRELVDECLRYWGKKTGNESFNAVMQRITTKAAGEEKAKSYDGWIKIFGKPSSRPATTQHAA